MTLNDIVVSALSQLDRGNDPQTIDAWSSKLTAFANDGAMDIASALAMRRTDNVTVNDGIIDISALPRPCIRLISVASRGANIGFSVGKGSSEVKVPVKDATVSVEYVYAPNQLSSASDVPEIPAYTHGLLVTYVVARERASGDVGAQRGANVYFDLYMSGRARLKHHIGESDTYTITNKW